MDETSSSANAEQARYWTEEGGPRWVRDEVVYDTMLTPFNRALLEELAPQPGEQVLDVGCGFGSTTLAIAARGAAAHGVDISPPMLRAQQRAAEARANATFAVGDAEEDSLGGPYDAATSRFGIMFFSDPVEAFRNIARATRLGGRLVFVCWQTLDRNPWMNAASDVLRGLLEDPPQPPPPGAGPFAFGDTEYIERVLRGAGWKEISITAFETPVRMGGDAGVEGAVKQALSSSVAQALLTAGDATLCDRATAILNAHFEALSNDGVVTFPAAAWLVNAQT